MQSLCGVKRSTVSVDETASANSDGERSNIIMMAACPLRLIFPSRTNNISYYNTLKINNGNKASVLFVFSRLFNYGHVRPTRKSCPALVEELANSENTGNRNPGHCSSGYNFHHVFLPKRTLQVDSGQCTVPKVPKTRYVPLDCVWSLLANCVARHYSYECKATAQERPYVSRPSRTQQLRNPKLVPKLTNDAPNPLEKK